MILTNPPFGGEEETGIQGNFPDDRQTSETALLFLQLIMRKLQARRLAAIPARAAVVVPNGTLFGDGVCARIKEELLKEFNLHTIVRLPERRLRALHRHPDEPAVLRPLRPDEEIWYYEQPLPEGRKNYTKTSPCSSRTWPRARSGSPRRSAWRTSRRGRLISRAVLDKAIAEATPHWDAAREASTRAHKLERQAKETKDELRANGKDAAQKAKLQAQLDELEAAAAKERKLQSPNKPPATPSTGRSSTSTSRTRTAPTPSNTARRSELVASILDKEREILRLMEEIQTEVEALA